MRKSAPFVFLLVTLFSFSCQKNEPKAFLPPELPEVADELRFDKHVIIEPTVATSCGACPLMHHEVERITDSLDQVFHMTHYTGGPMYHPFTTYILRDVDKTVYTPLAHINRAFEEGSMVYYPFTMVEGMVESELLKEARYALALNANTIDGKHFAEVRVKPKEESDAGLLMVHLFVVEKEVVELGPEYDQRNYGNDTPGHPFFGQGNWIEGFRHTNVIRALLTPEQGDEYNVDSELSFEYEVTDVAGFADRPADFAVIAAISKPGERLQPLLNAAYASF